LQPTPTAFRPASAISGNSDEGATANGNRVDGGEYENTPVVNPNVIRSSDLNEHDYAPESGAAKNILNK